MMECSLVLILVVAYDCALIVINYVRELQQNQVEEEVVVVSSLVVFFLCLGFGCTDK